LRKNSLFSTLSIGLGILADFSCVFTSMCALVIIVTGGAGSPTLSLTVPGMQKLN